MKGDDQTDSWQWERLPAWDGSPRTHAIAVAQAGKFFLFSGRYRDPEDGYELLTDAWCFDPAAHTREQQRAARFGGDPTEVATYANGWQRVAEIPSSDSALQKHFQSS